MILTGLRVVLSSRDVGNHASLRGTGDLHPCLRHICAALLYIHSLDTPPDLE